MNKKGNAIIFISLSIFALIVICLHFDLLKQFDMAIYNFISSFNLPFISGFWKAITMFASPVIIAIMLLIFILIISNKKYGLFLFINTVNIFILNQILKLIFLRPRPFELMLIDERGYSFPSGHAMVALAFFGLLIYFIWQMNLSKQIKKLFTILLIILILLIGISRIYLGVHYPSDVLAGYLVSLAYLIIFIKIIWRQKWMN